MENISNLIVAAAAVIGAIVTALLAGLAIWTFRDIRSRTRDFLAHILATVMVAVIPVAGILVYLMLRPRETLAEAYVRALEEESLLASIESQEFCPSCGRRVDSDMQFCPACHAKLRNACPGCGRAVHLAWDLCPYCGTTLAPELPVIKKPGKRQLANAPSPAAGALNPPQSAVSQKSAPMAAQTPAPSGNLLERIGGAIEGIVGRITGGKSSSTPSPEYETDRAGNGQRPTGASRTTPSRDEALE